MGTEDFVCWEAGLKRALIIIPVQAPLPEEHNPCAHRRMGLVISAISLQPFAASQHIRWPGTPESHWAAPSPVWALSDEEKTPEIVQSLFSYCPPSTLVKAPLEPSSGALGLGQTWICQGVQSRTTKVPKGCSISAVRTGCNSWACPAWRWEPLGRP